MFCNSFYWRSLHIVNDYFNLSTDAYIMLVYILSLILKVHSFAVMKILSSLWKQKMKIFPNLSKAQYHYLMFNDLVLCYDSILFQIALIVTGKKAKTKAPKIQRLVTPVVLQRKRHRLALKKKRHSKRREDAAEYAKILAQRLKEAKERKRSRSNSRTSMSASTSKWGCYLRN